MTRELKRLVKKFGGWIEDVGDEEIARFPTPHQKDEFLNACREYHRLQPKEGTANV